MDTGPEQLHRAIGPRALALATVNAIVGSGIFVLPALVAADLGAAAVLVYLLCGVLVFSISLCLAELGSGTSVSGGPYAYIDRAFGPFAGFLAANLHCFGAAMVADAAISNVLTGILAGFFPALASGAGRALFMVSLFSALAAINISSVRKGVGFAQFAALGKLVPLIALVLLATAFVRPANLAWTVTPSIGNLGAAALLVFYAFTGCETPLLNGGEMKDPRRTAPRGLLLGLSFVLVLYVGVQLVAQGVLGAELPGHKASPLGAVAGVVLGPMGALAIVCVTILSGTGCMGGNMLSTPRILYAAGRNGTMPPVLARVHPVARTPHIAIAVYATIGCCIALTGEFRQLAIISSASALLIYLGVVLAMLRERRRAVPGDRDTFRAPGGILVPALAIAGIVWLLSNLERKEWIGVGTFLALLGALYLVSLFVKRRKAARILTAPSLLGGSK
ncbi:MAG: amino acid permease [Flavobacteriales bacterium]